MSKDLFAEFGAPIPKEETGRREFNETPMASSFLQPTTSTLSSTSGVNKSAAATTLTTAKDVENNFFSPLRTTKVEEDEDEDEDEDDDFGDFEDPIQDALAKQTASLDLDSRPPQSANVVDPWTETSGNRLSIPIEESSSYSVHQPRDPDMFFDAEDPDEAMEVPASDPDDEFGDFEDVGSKQQEPQDVESPKQHTASMDLLDLDPEPPSVPSNTPSDFEKPRDFLPGKNGSALKPEKANTISRPTPLPPLDYSADDAWDDFETSTAQSTTSQTKNTLESSSSTTLIPPTHLLAGLIAPTPSGTPPMVPTNIPPPSVILPIFSALITTISSTFLQPLSTLPSTPKANLLLTPPTSTFLSSYHTLATIFAHILAGRRHRWKRDKHLAQSMSIGPSVSGRSGGMKLAGLDKTEASHEDREAVEALRLWRLHLGRLRSVVSAFNTAVVGDGTQGTSRQLPQVLELVDVMPVRTAKASEGAVVSLHACALCGLKREERVAKVDVDVEDSFGEWWIEGTNMHLSCFNFWEANKEKLRSR